MTHYQCPECDREARTPEELRKLGCECKREALLMLDPEDHSNSDKESKEKSKKTKRIIKKVKGKVPNFFVESILVDGEPRFLCYDLLSDKLSIKNEFETEDKIIKPVEVEEYGYIPYNFTKAEITKINRKLNKEKLLVKIKYHVDKFLVVRELDKYLILGDIMLSYNQEHINTIHFPFFVGETESGKSSATHLFRWLAYRCLYGEDIPNADIYNFLGTDEEGAGTIAEDEAQDISKNKDKIRTYKNSYSKGSVKPRIITTNYSKNQVYYKTFCLKVFAGERIPEDKGFRERLAVVNMLEGLPESNIKRLSDEEKQELYSLRKALLLFKIQNIQNSLPKIDSGLKQRDQELWEDFLRVVYGTKYYSKCLETVAYYTNQRHEAIWNSLEARIFKIVKTLLSGNTELRLEGFWHHLVNEQDELAGALEKETFYPHNYSTKITRNSLSCLFEDKFQAKRKPTYRIEEGKKHLITVYQFKPDVIEVLTKKYNIKNGSESENSSLVLSGRSGGSGQLFEAQADNVDHVDHLKESKPIETTSKENDSELDKPYFICYTCNEKGTEIKHVDYVGPNSITLQAHLNAKHNVKFLTKEEARLERDYQTSDSLIENQKSIGEKLS